MNNDGNVVAQINKRIQAHFFQKRIDGIRRTIRPGDVYEIPPRIVDPNTYSTSSLFRVKAIYPYCVEFEKGSRACTPCLNYVKLALYGTPVEVERPVAL